VWGQAFGAWGHAGGDGNATRLARSTGGFLIGADGLAFETWRLGLVAGYSHTSFNIRDRSSAGASDNFHAGLYGGTMWGDLAV
uniref:autotransporter domain-containing protein n=1 Tax=Stenotrophomonas maltophilia TaxID=40324 RepID=UPI0013D998BD